MRCPLRRSSRAALICAIVAVAGGMSLAAEDTYRQADVDQQGRLHIITAAGREIVPPMDKDQVGFDNAAISVDRRAVGWLALYPNCCTSYPIPLKLVILVNGRRRTFTGVGLAVSRWGFSDDGKRVAFKQETVHGGLGVHYELRDIATGRLVSEYGADSEKASQPPAWVRALDAAQ